MEECRRQAEKDLLASRCYPSFPELKRSIATYFRTKEIQARYAQIPTEEGVLIDLMSNRIVMHYIFRDLDNNQENRWR